jgi:hypothetical protein
VNLGSVGCLLQSDSKKFYTPSRWRLFGVLHLTSKQTLYFTITGMFFVYFRSKSLPSTGRLAFFYVSASEKFLYYQDIWCFVADWLRPIVLNFLCF